MSVQTALVAIKTADATLNSLIGTRFHPDALPQTIVLPAIRFQVISRPRSYTFCQVAPLQHVRVQFDCYVKSARTGGPSGGRETLADAVRSCFIRATPTTAGGEVVQGMLIDNESEDIETLGTSIEADHVRIDVIVHME